MPPEPDPSRPLSECLVGTWELLTREDHTRSGDRRIDPSLGENPVALLIYDGCGHFAAQFMKRDRDLVPDSEPIVNVPNNSRARGGYDAYFGTYSIDDTNNTVTQCLIGALSPENVGLELTREMTVVGDELTIRLETTTDDAEPVTRTLKWKRVGAW
jgi:hypothetical protein